MQDTPVISISYGDGVGPELMEAVMMILRYAHAKLRIETVEISNLQYDRQEQSGISPFAWDKLEQSKILLKGPMTLSAEGYNRNPETILKRRLGLFSNIRECRSYASIGLGNIQYENADIVIIKENEEGLYAGIEHRPSKNAYESMKLTTKAAWENNCNYAFNFANNLGRKRIDAFTEGDLLKISNDVIEGAFKKAAVQFSDIKFAQHAINLDIGKLVSKPNDFDVILASNIYGDVIYNILSHLIGCSHLEASVSVGNKYAIFQATHGSFPDLEGKDTANPSSLINAAVLMLVYLEQYDKANLIKNAWLKTIEDGIHTEDIYNEKASTKKVGTKDFMDAIIKNLGQEPTNLLKANYEKNFLKPGENKEQENLENEVKTSKDLTGVDVFFDWCGNNAEELAAQLLEVCQNTRLKLQLISSRGLKIWPEKKMVKVDQSDYWRGRFFPEGEKTITHQDILELLSLLSQAGLDYTTTKNLYLYNGELGFSLIQGE